MFTSVPGYNAHPTPVATDKKTMKKKRKKKTTVFVITCPYTAPGHVSGGVKGRQGLNFVALYTSVTFCVYKQVQTFEEKLRVCILIPFV